MRLVEGFPELIRDDCTQAIININNQEYNNYKNKKNQMMNDKQRIDNLENKLNDISSTLDKILERINQCQ